MITVDASKLDDRPNPNVYLLFGWEAVQARPNLDPYTSALRMNDETMQVYTSDVHLKHHVRRGLKALALQGGHPALAGYAEDGDRGKCCIFYEKTDESGNARTFDQRLQEIREAFGVEKGQEDKSDALNYCLDLPLFGYVHAVKNENFNVTNAANTLFRPVTFHECSILPLGRNNAFPGEDKESAGSAAVDSLEYGFFLALWEVNLNMLRINAGRHRMIPWNEDDPAQSFKTWLELLLDAMWLAYTVERYPSFTQRSQFAQFVVGWRPDNPLELTYTAPQDLIRRLPEDSRLVKSHEAALGALARILPGFLEEWQCRAETVFAGRTAPGFQVKGLPIPSESGS